MPTTRRRAAEQDLLGHGGLAEQLVANVVSMGDGCVVAVQASWGRGKTDVLGRMHDIVATECECRHAPRPIWINPWKYGSPDLLTPLVVELLAVMAEMRPSILRSDGKTTRGLLTALLQAGLSIGLKTASLAMPAGGLFKIIEDESNSFISRLTTLWQGEKSAISPVETDAVAVMGERFSSLVDQLLATLPEDGSRHRERLWIFLDDLDRCLPQRQVALLEAIHFLAAAKPRANFVVAMDPVLAEQSLAVHHGVGHFDPEKYLAKLFDLRVTLPSIDAARLSTLLQPLATGFDGPQTEVLMSKLAALLRSPEVRNPRVLLRVAQKLDLLRQRTGIVTRYGPAQAGLLVWWLCIAERWPRVRLAFQETPNDGIGEILSRVAGGSAVGVRACIARLPTAAEDPDLAECLDAPRHCEQPYQMRDVGATVREVETTLQSVGL
jgi:hypothetical protein